jgi:hypothetical protein
VRPEGGITPETINTPDKLLFIAPLKETKRSAEKVKADYKGNPHYKLIRDLTGKNGKGRTTWPAEDLNKLDTEIEASRTS